MRRRLKLLSLIARCLGVRVVVEDRRQPEPLPLWVSYCASCGDEMPFGLPSRRDGSLPERLMN